MDRLCTLCDVSSFDNPDLLNSDLLNSAQGHHPSPLTQAQAHIFPTTLLTHPGPASNAYDCHATVGCTGMNEHVWSRGNTGSYVSPKSLRDDPCTFVLLLCTAPSRSVWPVRSTHPSWAPRPPPLPHHPLLRSPLHQLMGRAPGLWEVWDPHFIWRCWGFGSCRSNCPPYAGSRCESCRCRKQG